VEVVHHDGLERLQEVLLEVKAHEFSLQEELISQLPEAIDSEDSYHEVRMRANVTEMVTQELPDHLPDKANTLHVKVSHLD